MKNRLFVHVALLSCLCFQRFGLTLGSSVLSVSLPVFAGLLLWMLVRGEARVSARATSWYVLLALSLVASAEMAAVFPDARVETSMVSLIAILVMYALWTIEPSERFDGSATLDIFLSYARLCAALGVVQYLIQFVGIKLFSFSEMLPFLDPVLIERYYAFNPILSYGSTTLRSNGFFLLEPSIFSQVLVLAAAIDFFVKRRYAYLPLYGAAYLFSFSGTGFLSLVLAIAIYGVTSLKNLQRMLIFAVAIAAILGVASVLSPQVLATFSHRAGELQQTGSSGYARYLSQFTSIEAFAREARSYVGYGPGATERSIYWVPGSGSPALKLFIDYGLIGLAVFFAFSLRVLLRSSDLIVPILCLVIFQVGGGNLLFSPFIVLMTLLCVWSRSPALGAARPVWPAVPSRHDGRIEGARAGSLQPCGEPG